MNSKKVRALLSFLTLTVSLGIFAGSGAAQNSTSIVITPPSPVISDMARQTELGKRRTEVRRRIGSGSIMIMMSAEPRIYTNDVDYPYRQENNFYYLTALKQENATLALLPGNGNFQEVLFIPKKNPAAEAWTGKMYSKDDVRRLSGVQAVLYDDELQPFIESLKAKKAFTSKEDARAFNTASLFGSAGGETKLYLLSPHTDLDENGKREFPAEGEFSAAWKAPGYKIENAQPFFAEMRLIKSPYELKLLQHAIDISTEAHMSSWAMAGRAKAEYEVQAMVEYVFRRRNADFWGYPSIVGCGPNATTLHYETNQDPVKAGDLLLMDVGAEYDHYTADVTRTFPVNGKFTQAQKEIYQAVYDAQEAVAGVIKPGATMDDVEEASGKSIEASLAKLGLITGVGAMVPGTEGTPRGRRGRVTNGTPQYRLWFIHGNSHWLGMNVHDVGNYSSPLKPGMTFTNEPGIYIREDALNYLPNTPEAKAFAAKIRPAFEKYKNIGVRIEDDMLVTANGTEWMTAKLPRTIAAIEAFMASAPKNFNYSGLGGAEEPSMFAFMTTTPAGQDQVWSPFAFNEFPSGVTGRAGWIRSGSGHDAD
jgi:Xaa-Pro aminopeptidase